MNEETISEETASEELMSEEPMSEEETIEYLKEAIAKFEEESAQPGYWEAHFDDAIEENPASAKDDADERKRNNEIRWAKGCRMAKTIVCSYGIEDDCPPWCDHGVWRPELYPESAAASASEPWASESFRILGEGVLVSNDIRKTGLNNNDLIIGPTGSGKTRSYIKPNLLQAALSPQQNAPESFIITDTKGNLLREVGPALAANGYEVLSIDFADVQRSTVGYNPLDYVRTDDATGQLHEQDVMRIAHTLCPVLSQRDPFWEQAAGTLIEAMVAEAMEQLPLIQRNLGSVFNGILGVSDEKIVEKVQQVQKENPASLFVRKVATILSCSGADRMFASIVGVAAQALSPFAFNVLDRLYCHNRRIDFPYLASHRCALFLTVSDTDRSMDKMVNLLYAQALNELCTYADSQPNSCLPIPVRLYLDDFAASAIIPDFDNITSVIRSRGIAVSIVLQSLTQLDALYGTDRARTIINNCAHILYLGGHDLATVDYIAALSNCMPDRILKMPVGTAFLYEDGTGGRLLPRYRLEGHPAYDQLPEAMSPWDCAA